MGLLITIIVGVFVFASSVISVIIDTRLLFLKEDIDDKREERALKKGKFKPNYDVNHPNVNGAKGDSLQSQISRGVADGIARADVNHGNSQGNGSFGDW